MAQYTEQSVQLQFLEEAQDYISSLESGLLGISAKGIDAQEFNAVLRAAHSIKGGAAMMGFPQLSSLAHRLEDFFKVLKTGRLDVDSNLERLLLSGVDCLSHITALQQKGVNVDKRWLADSVEPIYEALYHRIGDPQPEDEIGLLSEEAGADMSVLLFESEVEASLQRLEEVFHSAEQRCLQEEFLVAAQELEGLGQMLDLDSFVSLCQSIGSALEGAKASPQISAIAQLSLQALRRAQAMVLIGQSSLIPAHIDFKTLPVGSQVGSQTEHASPAASSAPHLEELAFLDDDDALDADEATDSSAFASPFEAEALEFLSALDSYAIAESSPDAELSDSELPISESSAAAAPEQQLPDRSLDQEIPEPGEDTLELLAILETAILETAISEAQDEAWSAQVPHPTLELHAPESAEEDRPAVANPASSAKITTQKVYTAAEPAPVARQDSADNTVRVSVKQLNEINELFGEMAIERNGLELQVSRLRRLFGLLNQRVQTLEQSNLQLRSAYDKVSLQAIPASASGSAHGPSDGALSGSPALAIENATFGEDFDLLELDRYSELHLLSQALMESAVQIQEVTADISTSLEDTEQNTRELSRTSKLIQVGMMQIRMRPISDITGRFPRMLRDLSLQSGKEVEFKLLGGTTLVERSILEALSDPLIHLVRNAFDHGIELPALRQASGKPAQGTIELKVAYRGNQTILTLRDDGGGIDFSKVKAKALALGLDAKDLEAATAKELVDLIFEPGFSTADCITDLSGRGVGMDIVRTNLQQVGGSIYVETQPGLGTTYTLAVPMTLSVVRVLLAECDSMLIAFPTDAVEEMVLLKPEMAYEHEGQTVFDWEGFTIPLLHLGQWLKFSQVPRAFDTDAVPIIEHPSIFLIAQDDNLMGIIVDRYWGEQEVSIRPVEGTMQLPPGFNGCTLLGDSRIAPLANPAGLLAWVRGQQAVAPAPTHFRDAQQSASSTTSSSLVMVVDDSVNVRRFLALTLEKAGYQVEQAKDGQQALEKVQTGLPIQAVICDIEMPRLDGYGFLANVKSIPGAQNIPVVMLTSRSGDKHRKLAMSLGASDYFSKPFREHELLQTLDQLIASA